jgi:hypothetical protein
MSTELQIKTPRIGLAEWDIDLTQSKCWADVLECKIFKFANGETVLAKDLLDIRHFIKKKLSKIEHRVCDLEGELCELEQEQTDLTDLLKEMATSSNYKEPSFF